MYRPKPKAVVILEETFVLLKPDVAERHGELINEFRMAGFFVASRQMATTRENLLHVCSQFADVAFARSEAERAMSSSLTYTQSPAGSFAGSTNGHYGSPTFAAPPRASRRSSHGSVNTANASGFGATRSTQPASDAGGSSTWEYLLQQHVNHCLKGTCIALVLSATNAVESALSMCGPDDPDVARTSAPDSIRAKYGSDMIRNAVFAAQTHQVAAQLIMSVFGYETQLKTELAEDAISSSQHGNGGGAHFGGTAGSTGPSASGATSMASALHLQSALMGLVDMQPTIPGADIIANNTNMGALAAADISENATAPQLMQFRQALLTERHALRREAEILREREVDLLLREERFASRLLEAARVHGASVVKAAADGIAVMPTKSPAPPRAIHNGGGSAPRNQYAGGGRHTSPLRGAPVARVDGGHGPGTATSLAHASRAIDHVLSVRPQQPSRDAKHAAHLREVIPQKRHVAAELRKEQRDLSRALEMISASDVVSEANALVAAMWTAVRADENERQRALRVLKTETPASPNHQARSPRGADGLAGSVNSVSSRDDAAAEGAVADVLGIVFEGFCRHVSQANSAAWNRRLAELEDLAQAAEDQVDHLAQELKVHEAKPQFTDLDAVEALSSLNTADLMAVASTPGTITSLFLRFDGAKETGRMQKADFMRFYESCQGFKDTSLVDDSRRVRDVLNSKYSPGKATMTLDEFSAILLWLMQL